MTTIAYGPMGLTIVRSEGIGYYATCPLHDELVQFSRHGTFLAAKDDLVNHLMLVHQDVVEDLLGGMVVHYELEDEHA